MKKYGALITFLLVSAIIFALFHKTIRHANQVSFAGGGDGLKSTFGTIYHIKHDSTYWHTGAMNYPFGESVFFTGNQVVLTNTLKLLRDAGWDLSDYALGISNILILLSFAIGSLFIYLILRELKIDWWMAIIAGILIMVLSPQWERLGGHYNLAYAYVIPLIIWMLLRFYRKPSYLISAIFGVLVILFSAKQLYIAAFIMILWIPFWIFLPFHNREKFGKPGFIISHVLIQFIVPFMLFNLFTGMHDPGLDRTAYPWGFYLSRINPRAVFLPIQQPHGSFIPVAGRVRSASYVGLLGSVVFLILIFRLVGGLFLKTGNPRKDDLAEALSISDNPAFNTLFWAGVLSLVVALGFPFSLGWERLLNYSGPFRQLRAVGRFVFPFYYMMTVSSFYLVWKWYRSPGSRLKIYFLLLILLFTAYEAAMHIHRRPANYHHKPLLTSQMNGFNEEYSWIKDIDPSEYQAIFPVPYFHVGSENYWIGDASPVRTGAYAVSLETGIPLNAVMLSRTSVKQTLLNTDLVREPYALYPILDHLPGQKPFLLIKHQKGRLSPWEERIVEKASLLSENEHLSVYSLETDSIRTLLCDRRSELKAQAARYKNEPSYLHYKDISTDEGGVTAVDFTRKTAIIDVPVPDTGFYTISFWFEGTGRDLWPRTNLYHDLYLQDGKHDFTSRTDLFRYMVLRDGPWGLVEFPCKVRHPNSILKVTLYNRYVTGGEINISRILVRKTGDDFLIEDDEGAWFNNRKLNNHGDGSGN